MAAARKKAETEKETGMKILRLFRRLTFAAKCRDLKARVKEQMVREELEEKMIIFETAKVTDVMCGICSVSFEWLLEKSMTKRDMVSDSFTIGRTNDNNAYRSDFEGKVATDAMVRVDQNFVDQTFTSEPPKNDMTNQEKNSNVINIVKSLVHRFYDSSGEKSNAAITSKEREINANNNAVLGERNATESMRSFSYESTAESGEKEGPTEKELKEMRARELIKIKEEHIQSKEHMHKELEFHSFKKLFKEKIGPKGMFMQEYILKYELGNPLIRSTVYTNMQLEINRMLFCMTAIHHEINRILHERSWKTTLVLHQLLEDMLGAYNAVQHYVEESYRTFKQRQEEQQVATASQVKVPDTDKVRSQVFQNKRRGRRS